MKILIIIDQMGGGGGARVTSCLCRGLVENGYEVSMLTDNVHHPVAYPLPANVDIIPFPIKKNGKGLWKTLKFNFDLIKAYRKKIHAVNPDAIIAVMALSFFYSKLASIGLGKTIIACDHTSFNRKVSRLVDFVRYHFYKYADILTILTNKDANLLGKKFPNKVVIHNPLPFPILNHKTQRRKNILCVGRLKVWKIKGVDIIIDIWAEIANKNPEWVLEIAGTGTPESVNYIKSLINEKGLNNRVVLLGQVNDMAALLQSTSIFALPSRMEGLPMSLIEAASQGCACVAFEVGGAINEVITDGVSGYIVKDGDSAEFKLRLERLMHDPQLRESIGYSAIKESEKFSQEKFMNQWMSLLQRIEK